jgi:hypothetical protein
MHFKIQGQLKMLDAELLSLVSLGLKRAEIQININATTKGGVRIIQHRHFQATYDLRRLHTLDAPKYIYFFIFYFLFFILLHD